MRYVNLITYGFREDIELSIKMFDYYLSESIPNKFNKLFRQEVLTKWMKRKEPMP